eukprot:15863-Heterococcus_DN1.PRE.1
MHASHTKGSEYQYYLIVLVLLALESALSSESLSLIIGALCSEVLQASNGHYSHDHKATKPRGEEGSHSTKDAHAAAAAAPTATLTLS